MPYAIARIAKLKKSNLGGSGAHTTRERDTPNADPEKQNTRIIDTDPEKSLSELVLDKISQHPQNRRTRSDAVYCVEIIFTASPDFFRSNEPNNGGFYQEDKLHPWVDATKKFLDNKYGSLIVRAELHLDEMNPHIHAYCVTLDQNGQLRCNHFFGTRQKLQEFQDSYYQAVKHLGLERGIKGSVAQHEDIKNFYHTVNEGKELELTPLNKTQITNKAADRDRAVKQKLEMEATAQRLALENEQLQKQAQLLQTQNQQLRNQLEKEKEKDLPLDSVAWHLGMSENKSTGTWEGHNKTITVDSFSFHDQDQNRNTGSVNLVMQVNDYKLDQALAWIGDRFGKEGMAHAIKANADDIAHTITQTYPVPQFEPPQPEPSNWEPVEDYLVNQHGLDQNFVTQLHQQQLVYADKQKNAVFLTRELPQANSTPTVNGAILQSISKEKSPQYALGTKRNQAYFYFSSQTQSNSNIQQVVLSRSPINSISNATMEQSKDDSPTMYLAVDSPQSLPVNFLQKSPNVISDHTYDLEMEVQIQQLVPQIQFVDLSHEIQELSEPSNKKQLEKTQDDLDLDFE